MKHTKTILVYILLVFCGAALIAPWIYHAAQSLASSHPKLASITDQPFHRYVNRCLVVLALVGLWPMARSLGIRSFRDLGLYTNPSFKKDLAVGWIVGFVGLATVIAVTLTAGGRVLRPNISPSLVAQAILSASATAMVVAMLEEILFRGALFGRLRDSIGVKAAILASAATYAIMHFFARPDPPAEVTGWTGFVVLGGMLKGFTQVQEIVPGFLTLTIAGVLLAQAYHKTGTLWMALGIHAAWIFWMKLYGALTMDPTQSISWLWGSHKLIDGWLALLIMCGTSVWIWKRVRNQPPTQTIQN